MEVYITFILNLRTKIYNFNDLKCKQNKLYKKEAHVIKLGLELSKNDRGVNARRRTYDWLIIILHNYAQKITFNCKGNNLVNFYQYYILSM